MQLCRDLKDVHILEKAVNKNKASLEFKYPMDSFWLSTPSRKINLGILQTKPIFSYYITNVCRVRQAPLFIQEPITLSDVLSVIYISDVNIQKEAFCNESSSSLVSIRISLQCADRRGRHICRSHSCQMVCVPGDLEAEKKVAQAVRSETVLQTSTSCPRAHNWEQYFISAP
ncbi:uncharacterized protein LJ206_014376 isoform 1-T1 [Theristicus caerulescens]